MTEYNHNVGDLTQRGKNNSNGKYGVTGKYYVIGETKMWGREQTATAEGDPYKNQNHCRFFSGAYKPIAKADE